MNPLAVGSQSRKPRTRYSMRLAPTPSVRQRFVKGQQSLHLQRVEAGQGSKLRLRLRAQSWKIMEAVVVQELVLGQGPLVWFWNRPVCWPSGYHRYLHPACRFFEACDFLFSDSPNSPSLSPASASPASPPVSPATRLEITGGRDGEKEKHTETSGGLWNLFFSVAQCTLSCRLPRPRW